MFTQIRTFIRLFIERVIPSFWFKKISYSQDGEDLVLNSFYEGIKKYNGFYVDIGAHHPYRFSNTAIFYKKGWTGINIEPTPNLYLNFLKYRKKDINLNIGIGQKKESLTFYEFNESAINTFSKEYADRIISQTNYKLQSTSKVEIFPLGDILDKYVNPNQIIDFFTIDVEGLDLEVLRSNNWEKYKPKFLLVENYINNSGIEDNQIKDYLSKYNYIVVGKTKRTLILQRK